MKERTYIDDPPSNGRPLGEIFKDILSHIAEIIRSELRLVTAEVRQEVASLKVAAISIVLGAILTFYGGVFLLLGLVYALSSVWPLWLSALAVGAGVAILGSIVVSVGIGKLKRRN